METRQRKNKGIKKELKEIEKIKYLSFLQGTVDGDTGEE
jgi:hypothetical protein